MASGLIQQCPVRVKR